MEITVNNVNITLTPKQITQICNEANKVKQGVIYPIFKMSKTTKTIVKFTDLSTGETVWQGEEYSNIIGRIDTTYVKHTNTGHWEDVAYDAERDLWDGQPIYCWYDEDTHQRQLKFYDAINKCPFNFKGERDGPIYNNYKAINPSNYTKWTLEAFNKLERNLI